MRRRNESKCESEPHGILSPIAATVTALVGSTTCGNQAEKARLTQYDIYEKYGRLARDRDNSGTASLSARPARHRACAKRVGPHRHSHHRGTTDTTSGSSVDDGLLRADAGRKRLHGGHRVPHLTARVCERAPPSFRTQEHFERERRASTAQAPRHSTAQTARTVSENPHTESRESTSSCDLGPAGTRFVTEHT